ncbi:MAG TPA: HAD family hydrolase [Actinomycetota bacterium]|nr:HAD family hydrolase [Actinomycetota bacterium]
MAADDFENVPGRGAVATVQGRRVAVGNRRLMDGEQVDLGPLAARREQLASGGRTVVMAAADGRPLGLFAIADAPRETSFAAVQALHDANVQVVMLTGDNRATAERMRMSRVPWNFGGGPSGDQAASSLVGVTSVIVASRATRRAGRYR